MTTNRALRHLVYGLLLAVASLFTSSNSTQAAVTPAVFFDEAMITGGRTLTLDDGAKAGIFPGALPGPAEVQWTINQGELPELPSDHQLLGSVYRLTISGVDALSPAVSRPLAVSIPAGQSYWIRQIWAYDQVSKQWSPRRTKFNRAGTLAQAAATKLDALYVILEDRQQQEGVASWYCRYRCSSRYPTMHGASNDYPIGSMVTVRSLENGRSVRVKVISRWGQPAGRVIDLSYAAFAALKPKNGGLTRVNVSPVSSGQVKASTSNQPHDRVETLPSVTVNRDDVPAPAAVQAITYSVFDQTTGTVLADRQGEAIRPIASITKLMTAMVFIDTKTPLTKVLTYASSDQAPCSCLTVKGGDTLTVRDLFYAMLVGSANNAANALVRSTGLSRDEFVARMNAKAAALGLSQTHFVDPTGLGPENVSTANETAKMAAHAFHVYEPIRYVTTRRWYTFSTINTGQKHTIQLRYSIYSRRLTPDGLTVTGGKTGYLDEALATYALRVKNSQGAQVVVVVLGSPPYNTYVQRLNDVAALVDWVFRHHTWT